jgi:hypothetical protein
MQDASIESVLETYRTQCKENMAKKVLEKNPNTFSIVYRRGPSKTMRSPPILEAEEEFPIEHTNTHFTGKFTDDISEYFRNRLIEGGVDITDDIAIRTSPLTWNIYFEVSCGLVQMEGSTISTSDLLKHNPTNFVEPCTLHILENIPMCLFTKFNIIHYPSWGEVVMFQYDALKSEILDHYILSGSDETMRKQYQKLLDTMKQFPNTYTLLSEKILNTLPEKPFEITREETRILQLRTTRAFQKLLEEKREIEAKKPDPDADGVYSIEDGVERKGPNYTTWKTNHAKWVATYTAWFANIEHEYKLCFKACYEKMLMLDTEYEPRDFQFPGYIMHTNISGNIVFHN